MVLARPNAVIRRIGTPSGPATTPLRCSALRTFTSPKIAATISGTLAGDGLRQSSRRKTGKTEKRKNGTAEAQGSGFLEPWGEGGWMLGAVRKFVARERELREEYGQRGEQAGTPGTWQDTALLIALLMIFLFPLMPVAETLATHFVEKDSEVQGFSTFQIATIGFSLVIGLVIGLPLALGSVFALHEIIWGHLFGWGFQVHRRAGDERWQKRKRLGATFQKEWGKFRNDKSRFTDYIRHDAGPERFELLRADVEAFTDFLLEGWPIRYDRYLAQYQAEVVTQPAVVEPPAEESELESERIAQRFAEEYRLRRAARRAVTKETLTDIQQEQELQGQVKEAIESLRENYPPDEWSLRKVELFKQMMRQIKKAVNES